MINVITQRGHFLQVQFFTVRCVLVTLHYNTWHFVFREPVSQGDFWGLGPYVVFSGKFLLFIL